MAGFENQVLLCDNVNFNTGLPAPHPALMTTNGQLIIGSTALNAGGTHLNIGELTSVGGTIAISYSSPNINLETTPGGSSVVKIVRQVFTSSGTYTPTTNMSYCDIEVVGGGGGGGGSLTGSFQNAAGGGAGAGYARGLFSSTTIGASQSVTIGAGGTAGPNTGASPGGTGGSTSVGSLISATGGAGGAGANVGGIFAGSGAPGIGTGGDFRTEGAPGYSGDIFVGGLAVSGEGGSSFFGGGGVGAAAGATTSIVGNNGNSAGGGASGAACNDGGSSQVGGTGASGIVVITEYISFAGGGGGGGGTVEFTTDISGPVTEDDGIINVTGTNIYSDGTVAHRLILNVQAPQNLLLVGTGDLTPATTISTDNQALLNTNSSGVPTWQTSPLVSGTMTALLGYVGIISGSGPSAGIIGQLINQTTSSTAITNNSATALISVSLSPGIWDIQGCINYLPSAIVGTLFESTISTAVNTRGFVPNTGQVTPTAPTAASGITLLTPNVRVNPTTTTVYYLTAYSLYSVGSLNANATMNAVRVA